MHQYSVAEYDHLTSRVIKNSQYDYLYILANCL